MLHPCMLKWHILLHFEDVLVRAMLQLMRALLWSGEPS